MKSGLKAEMCAFSAYILIFVAVSAAMKSGLKAIIKLTSVMVVVSSSECRDEKRTERHGIFTTEGAVGP